MIHKSSHLVRSQSRKYYRQNTLSKNRQDSARRILQREGLFVFHDDLRERLATGEVDANAVLVRYLSMSA
jgi:hypothetical protein